MEQLKAIYDKHSVDSFDEMQAEAEQEKKTLFEDLDLDMDFEAFQNMSQEDMADLLKKKMFEGFGFTEPKPRKKTKKQLEAEAKEAEAEAKMKKDARSIYTQLAKLLHPDTEMDEVIREEKSEMMKRVTNAYSNNDLYELLQIQLEVEQLSEDKLAATDDGLMESYINVLKKQKSEIQTEINQTQYGHPLFREFFDYTGRFIESRFKKKLKEIKDAKKQMDSMHTNCNSQLQFKEFAKQMAKEKRQMDILEDDVFFFG
jgi:ubiquitin